MNRCNRCRKEKNDSEFITSRGKPSTRCIGCRKDRTIQARAYYKRWHEVIRRGVNIQYHKNHERFIARNKNARLKRKYGINLDEYEAMMKRQGGMCGICGLTLIEDHEKGFKKMRPCVDHNHKTGKVRGILCRGCNLSLSMVENENFLSKANQYLKQVGEVLDKELTR